MANIAEESRFDPTLRHPDQPRFGGEAHFAHGLYQEGGDEWNNYAAWLKQNYPNADWRDPRLQSRFAAENLKRRYPNVWARMNAGNREQAAEAYVSGYLKPAARYQASRIAGFRSHGVPPVSSYTGGREAVGPGGLQRFTTADIANLGGGVTGSTVGSTHGGGGGLDAPTRYLHLGGDVTMDGQTYHWGSGGAGGASMPLGDYYVNFGLLGQRDPTGGGGGVGPRGASGWGGRLPPAVAGINTSPSGNLSGFEIHSGSSDQLDRLYSAGCFAIARSEWPRFRAALLDKASREGKLMLHVHAGRDGRPVASITSAHDGQPVVAAGEPVTGGLTPRGGFSPRPQGPFTPRGAGPSVAPSAPSGGVTRSIGLTRPHRPLSEFEPHVGSSSGTDTHHDATTPRGGEETIMVPDRPGVRVPGHSELEHADRIRARLEKPIKMSVEAPSIPQYKSQALRRQYARQQQHQMAENDLRHSREIFGDIGIA
jgi:hypothetical protein